MIRAKEQRGQRPSTRFGHTTTLVNENTIVLFGGATGDAGRYIITGETHALDLRTSTWRKVEVEGIVPPARAAHAACAVDLNQLVIYGGATGGGTLSPEELMLMDYREAGVSAWLEVPVKGPTPGRRYGHSMVYHKPLIIVYGGNTGAVCTDHIYFLDVDTTPFAWERVTLAPNTPKPPARVYHTAEVCRDGPASGMMVVFGGRTADGTHLRDVWGLRQHRDGRWDWVEAPSRSGEAPVARCQHSATFVGSQLVISGGRGDDVAVPLATSVYSTKTCEWTTLPTVNRFRHATWSADKKLFVFGGFEHSNAAAPTDSLQLLDIEALPSSSSSQQPQTVRPKSVDTPTTGSSPAANANAATPNIDNNNNGGVQPRAYNTPMPHTGPQTRTTPLATAPPPMPVVVDSPSISQQQQQQSLNNSGMKSSSSPTAAAAAAAAPRPAPQGQNAVQTNGVANEGRFVTPQMGNNGAGEAPPHQHFTKMSSNVVVSKSNNLSTMVHKMNINQLEEEGRKLRTTARAGLPLTSDDHVDDSLAGRFIAALLKPGNHVDSDPWAPNPERFVMSWQDVAMLCDQTMEVMMKQPSLMRLRAPIKIYGDIHGQFSDLMRLFTDFGGPWEGEGGDIETTEYLFLGDYVDRGNYSLETICLLFALKLKYPSQIHLIRGNHEDPNINSTYGFEQECARRLAENTRNPNSCWSRFNTVFQWLPLGALIEERILCIHGGIGGSIDTLEDIASIKRPLEVQQVPTNAAEQKITDLLWSDPTDHDGYDGILVNSTRDPDGTGRIFKFGPDRVQQFLQNNRLDLIVRAHECVMDGFERFAAGQLITLFSATDYCQSHKNAGALLFVRRDLTVVPKVIFPTERSLPQWDNSNIEARPPTPPRPQTRYRMDISE